MNSELLVPPLRRARMVSAVAAGVVLMHLGHLALLATVENTARPVFVVLSGLVWVALLCWTALRGARLGHVEVALVCAIGGVAITVDAVFTGSPGRDVVCTVGLVTLSVGVGVFSSPRALVIVGPLLGTCQVLIVLSTQGLTPLGLYAAASTVSIAAGACLVIWWAEQGRQRALRALARSAVVDPLTGLLNRRGMTEAFAGLRRAAPAGTRVGVVAVDLDHFKAVNDALGHDGGDQVLVAVAGLLAASARSGDLVVRLGGEELAWFGAWHSTDDAAAAAERLRTAVAAAPMPHGARVTLSAGVALSPDATHAPPDTEALSRLMVRSDAALYAAKAAGRDRVEVAPALLPSGRDPHHERAWVRRSPRATDDAAPVPPVGDEGCLGAASEAQRA